MPDDRYATIEVEVLADTDRHLFGAPVVVGEDPAKEGAERSAGRHETWISCGTFFSGPRQRSHALAEEPPISWEVIRQAVESCRKIEKKQGERLTFEQVQEAVGVFEVGSTVSVTLARVVCVALNLDRSFISGGHSEAVSRERALTALWRRLVPRCFGRLVPVGWCMASRGWMNTGWRGTPREGVLRGSTPWGRAEPFRAPIEANVFFGIDEAADGADETATVSKDDEVVATYTIHPFVSMSE